MTVPKKSILCNDEDRLKSVLLLGGGFRGGLGVFLGEALHAASGVHKFLFAREERVAI